MMVRLYNVSLDSVGDSCCFYLSNLSVLLIKRLFVMFLVTHYVAIKHKTVSVNDNVVGFITLANGWLHLCVLIIVTLKSTFRCIMQVNIGMRERERERESFRNPPVPVTVEVQEKIRWHVPHLLIYPWLPRKASVPSIKLHDNWIAGFVTDETVSFGYHFFSDVIKNSILNCISLSF